MEANICSLMEGGGYEGTMGSPMKYITDVCQQYHVDETHSLNHALNVMKHMEKCLKYDRVYNLDKQTNYDLILTCLFHDLDDHKYFPPDAHNAQKFLEGKIPQSRVDRILRWISYVSTSVNGNNIPSEAKSNPWVLWPRYCDRIEAVGKTGIIRVIDYSHHHKVMDFVETTPRAKTVGEVLSFATPDRFERYISNHGESDSIIDHIYDKLLHLCNVETYSPYLNQCLMEGKQILVDTCLHYGLYGVVKYP